MSKPLKAQGRLMVDVFVSYVREDEKKVSKIVERLEDNGTRRVWWDRLLKPGENFSLVIEEKIEESQNVLVAWSDRSRTSLYVRGEALDALERGKLVQVVIDKSRLPVPFNALQAVYLDDWNGERDHQKWGELVTVIDGRGENDEPEDGAVTTVIHSELSDREISSVGVSGIQRTALWLMPLLLCGLVVLGVALMLDVVPTFGLAKQTIFLTMGGGIVIILGVLISMLINTLLMTLEPRRG